MPQRTLKKILSDYDWSLNGTSLGRPVGGQMGGQCNYSQKAPFWNSIPPRGPRGLVQERTPISLGDHLRSGSQMRATGDLELSNSLIAGPSASLLGPRESKVPGTWGAPGRHRGPPEDPKACKGTPWNTQSTLADPMEAQGMPGEPWGFQAPQGDPGGPGHLMGPQNPGGSQVVPKPAPKRFFRSAEQVLKNPAGSFLRSAEQVLKNLTPSFLRTQRRGS